MGAIHTKFELPVTLPDDVATAIKTADRIAAYFEATRLAGFDDQEARRFFGEPGPLPAALEHHLGTLTAIDTGLRNTRFRRQCAKLWQLLNMGVRRAN